MASKDVLQAPLLSKNNQNKAKISIDDMLQHHAGEFGRWQLKHFILTSLAWALEAMHTMVIIFSDRNVDWRCVAGAGCHRVGPEPCGLDAGMWEWVDGRGGSTVADFGLICGEKYKVGLVQSGFFLGCMVGAGVFGHLSDSFLGRKGSLTIVCTLNSIFGLLTAFSPTYPTYLTLRILTGFSTGGVGLCAFVLATEPVGPTMRGIAGMSTFYFFSGGIALLSGVAYLFRSWRTLYIVTSLPSLLFVITILPFLSESPRWYLVRRKLDEAMHVMHTIARVNKKSIPEGTILKLDDDDEEEDGQKNEISGSIIDVVRSPTTRVRLFLATAINLLCSVVYYGLSLNVVNLKTNIYLSVLLNSVAEMPAYILTALLLDWFGRKPLGVGTMWFSGVFCVAGAIVGGGGGMRAVRMACSVVGIFGMAATYNLLFIYTTELFPTVVRNAALGCATQAAQLGAILAPLVVVLGGSAAFAVFGVCGVLGGLFVFYLPETLNMPMYDTMSGMEKDGAGL